MKKNNHFLPRFIIKKWENANGKIYDKLSESIRNVNFLDYSEKYYYSLGKKDDHLENRISIFETYIGKIIKRIEENNNNICLSFKELEILKLYVILQSCRNENTSPVINFDESGIYQNNNYLIGVPLINSQTDAVKLTTLICDEFEKIKKSKDLDSYKNFENIISINQLNSFLTFGQHLVILKNNKNSFLISETTAIIECTLDSDYLYTYVPVSPNIALMLVKSKYFYDENNILYTRKRFGAKYGGGTVDPYISEMIDDKKLCFRGTINYENHEAIIEYNYLSEEEVYSFNSIIFEDGKNILFSNIDALEKSKKHNNARKVYCK